MSELNNFLFILLLIGSISPARTPYQTALSPINSEKSKLSITTSSDYSSQMNEDNLIREVPFQVYLMLLGVLILPFSIVLASFVERQSTKETQFLDELDNPRVKELLHHNLSNARFDTKNLNIYKGFLVTENDAKIPFIDEENLFEFRNNTLNIDENQKKILAFEIEVNEFVENLSIDTNKELNLIDGFLQRYEKNLFKKEYYYSKYSIDKSIQCDNIIKNMFLESNIKKNLKITSNIAEQFRNFISNTNELKDYKCILIDNNLYLCRDYLHDQENSNLFFFENDYQIKINYIEVNDIEKITILGNFRKNETSENMFEIKEYETHIMKSDFWTFDYRFKYKYSHLIFNHLTKTEIKSEIKKNFLNYLWLIRILSLIIHVGSVVILFYPIISLSSSFSKFSLLISITSFSLTSYLIIIVTRWIKIRLMLSIVLSLLSFLLLIVGIFLMTTDQGSFFMSQMNRMAISK